MTVKKDFLQTNADYYGAAAYKSAFDDQTVKDINNWVSENTDGMIEQIIDEINLHKFLQFYFFKGWNKLKNYAHQKGIKFIGDLPIYVSYDSSDVWSNPLEFLLNQNQDLFPSAH